MLEVCGKAGILQREDRLKILQLLYEESEKSTPSQVIYCLKVLGDNMTSDDFVLFETLYDRVV
jgi:hypothetical protein